MDPRLIALAVPGFFFLITVEAIVSRLGRVRRYRLHDTITSLACGTGEQVVVVFTLGLALAGYAFVSRHAALTRIPTSSVLAWVLLMVLVDHSYYWFHRASHRVNFLWAGHAVHHQSEEYNLSTALRQNWIENLLAWPFYLPLAMVGFPIEMFATASTVNTLYQFWVHTRVIKRLGPVEGVLNTPSSHRVHHGIDPKYVDRNYGGMFMLWDRAYGTYQPEAEEPHYGTVKPLTSWNPLWANLDGWVRIVTMSMRTTRFTDKLRAWVAPPDWRPRDLGGVVIVPEVDPATYRKWDSETPRATNRYVILQFVFISLATTLLMRFAGTLPFFARCGAVSWVLAALVVWGGLFEGKRWAVPLEVARQAFGVALAVTLGKVVLVPAVVLAALSLAMLVIVTRAPNEAYPVGE